MKRSMIVTVGCLLLFVFSCGPRPQYKTHKGKKKLKHYNELQHNKADWEKAKKKH